MASYSSASPDPNPFGQQVTERLTRDNFLLWKVVVLLQTRGARFIGYIDGTTVAPPEFLEVKKPDKSGTEKISNPLYET